MFGCGGYSCAVAFPGGVGVWVGLFGFLAVLGVQLASGRSGKLCADIRMDLVAVVLVLAWAVVGFLLDDSWVFQRRAGVLGGVGPWVPTGGWWGQGVLLGGLLVALVVVVLVVVVSEPVQVWVVFP